MGTFVYGNGSLSIDFDDRVLAHLRVVISAKLRRSEGFLFTWSYAVDTGSGRSSAWMHPAIPVRFDFLGSREPQLNRDWLERLSIAANSPGGLVLVAEITAEGAELKPVLARRPSHI